MLSCGLSLIARGIFPDRLLIDLTRCLLIEGVCSFLAFVGFCAFLVHPNNLARLGTW